MANTVYRSNGIAISQSGGASQLIIYAHGGWKELETHWYRSNTGDGMTITPWASKVYFYVEDERPNIGRQAYTALMKRSGDKRKGLTATHTATDKNQIEDARGAIIKKATPDDDPILVQQQLSALDGNLETAKLGMVGHMEVAYTHTSIKDYALYYHQEGVDDLFPKHVSQTPDFWNQDMDLLVIEDQNHKKHLSEVFRLSKESSANYSVFHYLACRVNRPYVSTYAHNA